MRNLDRDDMMEAVSEGVRRGFVEVASRQGRFDIPDELLFDAVRKGVRDAVWQVATNATQAPSADFYETIRAGVEAAMMRLKPGPA